MVAIASIVRSQEIIDEEDWAELDRGVSGVALPEVSVRVTISAKGGSATRKARVYLAFRGEAAKWLVERGPRFRVGLAGQKANFLRIVPDLHHGKFELGDSSRGETKRMNLGVLAAWPPEARDMTAAEWDVSHGYMRLRLPENFAVAREAPLQRRS